MKTRLAEDEADGGQEPPLFDGQDVVAENQAVMSVILDSLIDGVVTIDERGIIKSVNRAVEQLFGYCAEELVNENVSLLMPAPDSEKHDQYISNYLSSGIKKIIGIGREVEAKRKDGTLFPVYLGVSEVCIGGKTLFAGVIRDISQRVKAGQELEKRVQERTRQLADSNQVLSSEIAKRAKFQEELESSLKEKEVLLKEVHHRVKNNLQLILSLLKLQKRRAKEISTEDLVMEVQNRVRSIALLHEMLYRAEDLGRIDFLGYARALTEQLLRYYGKTQTVTLDVRGRELKLAIEPSIPCGLILNELVSNCLKHAFPGERKGIITISLLEEEGGIITLRVSDDGIGFSKSDDPENIDSLGLELVRKLTKQVKGSLEFQTTDGTTVEIRFHR